jgi:hypothetical protein
MEWLRARGPWGTAAAAAASPGEARVSRSRPGWRGPGGRDGRGHPGGRHGQERRGPGVADEPRPARWKTANAVFRELTARTVTSPPTCRVRVQCMKSAGRSWRRVFSTPSTGAGMERSARTSSLQHFRYCSHCALAAKNGLLCPGYSALPGAPKPPLRFS